MPDYYMHFTFTKCIKTTHEELEKSDQTSSTKVKQKTGE